MIKLATEWLSLQLPSALSTAIWGRWGLATSFATLPECCTSWDMKVVQAEMTFHGILYRVPVSASYLSRFIPNAICSTHPAYLLEPRVCCLDAALMERGDHYLL